MNDVAWLFAAFVVVWATLGIYLLSIGARQRRLEARLDRALPDHAEDPPN